MKENNLLMFVGTDCPHCMAMRPLLAKLAFDTGIVVEERDTWKNQSDYRLLENYQEKIGDKDCDGIPFFYNTKTEKYLCGEVNYKTLKKWAESVV
jgi:thiol-disulfide isomerase/thioredoxin